MKQTDPSNFEKAILISIHQIQKFGCQIKIVVALKKLEFK